jgi:acetoacetate decarboxylase
MVRAAKEIGRADARLHNDTLVGTPNYSDVLVATATMSYGHETMQPDDAERAAGSSGVVLKIMPHVDGTPRIVELVRFDYADVVVMRPTQAPEHWSSIGTHWRP